jgi:N-carbamoyl-L-amino-acid hydrolase
MRRDAVRDAIAIINALQELTRDPTDTTRFTVGRMLVTPNSPNSVASHVLFSVDVRHPDPPRSSASAMRWRARRGKPPRAAT